MMRGLMWIGFCLSLAGCTGTGAKHHGYAADGYGIIDNSPHLPPPPDLTRPAPAPDKP
ncbi:hypothetical protein [Neoasaia chiangmaiensis]|uniref:hypothetical protein n=2 Tax=Neoasaia chiangmaiensis TaxID=320497 RepID=UPI001472BAE8|nr:hypothetical protein [Neoasaia chiangmaiensis]